LKQLKSRHYRKSTNNGRIFLKTKREEKAEGFHSPDRADAFVLAFADYKFEWKDTPKNKEEGKPFTVTKTAPPVPPLSVAEWAKRPLQPTFNMTSNYRPSEGEYDNYADEIRRMNEFRLTKQN